jgi:2-polyprenyl-6-hydroxyphenyl methylase/3-demethylubiquinone-9 3-methyltransferase
MHNADTTELEKFAGRAGDWWDRHGPFRTLHEINDLRTEYIAARVPVAGARLLDVGCGGGVLSEALARRGADVIGIDLAEASLAVARAHAAAGILSIDYRAVEIETLAANEAGSFDVVTCLEVVEHVPEPAGLVAACATVLRPGGSAFFSTINRNAKSFLLGIVAAEYVLRLVPRGTHEYLKLVRPSELAGFCRAASLDVRDITGLHYNPVTGVHRLGGNADVNYFLHAVKPGTV